MEMEIVFPGGARVDATFNGFTVRSDQSFQNGGEDSAPNPFAQFLASIGTCVGVYVLGFCRKRGLPTEAISLHQIAHTEPTTGIVDHIELQIRLPADFPEKYREPLIRAAELCAVKKHLENPPSVSVGVETGREIVAI